MSFDLYIDGIIPCDDAKFVKMKHIRQSCNDLGIKEPREVTRFLDCENMSADGKGVYIEEAISPSKDPDSSGTRIIDLKKLPRDVTQIRIMVSW
jgi:hypothetical protein